MYQDPKVKVEYQKLGFASATRDSNVEMGADFHGFHHQTSVSYGWTCVANGWAGLACFVCLIARDSTRTVTRVKLKDLRFVWMSKSMRLIPERARNVSLVN